MTTYWINLGYDKHGRHTVDTFDAESREDARREAIRRLAATPDKSGHFGEQSPNLDKRGEFIDAVGLMVYEVRDAGGALLGWSFYQEDAAAAKKLAGRHVQHVIRDTEHEDSLEIM